MAAGLENKEIHLWWIRLDPGEEAVERHLGLLDREERERADRFRFARHRTRHIVSHGAMRAILGRYLDAAPESLRYQFGERGKPRLDSRHGGGLFFNLTHSHRRAIVGLWRGGELGVDLEQVRPLKDFSKLAKRVFCSREVEQLEAADEESRQDTFFLLWTRKEALIKATGEGLAEDLRSLDVMPRNWREREFEQVAGREGTWSAATFRPRPGWVAAVAVEGKGARLKEFEFPSD